MDDDGNKLRIWKALPFSERTENKALDNETEAEWWNNFSYYLTNGSDGAIVTIAQDCDLPEIVAGDIVVFDTNVKSQSGDLVVINENDELRVTEYEPDLNVFGVVTFIGKLTEARHRQRESLIR